MHKAKACILLCIDFRFQKQIQKWLEDQGYLGSSDEIVVAGASRDLVKPIEPFHKHSLMRQLELSINLHDPDEIVVIDHQDCGGYAQDQTIPSGLEQEEDKKGHTYFAIEAKKMLEEKFPDRLIRNYYATLKGTIEPLIEESRKDE
jgi:carbonic anhydrase